MPDILGHAISDYYFKTAPSTLWIHNRYGDAEEMPVSIYFRRPQDMPKLERMALNECVGTVLDVGAGAGSHALWLQQKKIDVTALDISAGACEVMKLRGVSHVVQADIFSWSTHRFDTLLLLMNGIGLSATLDGLRIFLRQAETILKPAGTIVFDSSDVAYLYDHAVPPMKHYYGEIDYEYAYKNERSGWFRWLYVDANTMEKIAGEEGWKFERLFTDENEQYLARLSRA